MLRRAGIRTALTLLAVAVSVPAAEAGRARRVKDIVTARTPYQNTSSTITVVGSTAYLLGWTEETGLELWKTDGTAAGTTLVADTCPGTCNGWPLIGKAGGTLFLNAGDAGRIDGRYGWELYKSDGTAAGTVLVKDINPGLASSNPVSFVDVNGTLFFAADDGSHGMELWRSDGTEAGTTLVADIAPGTTSGYPQNVVSLNGVLLFSAADGVSGRELWRSDGTAAGTYQVADVLAGDGSSSPAGLVVMGGAVYFVANDGVNGSELWKTDGTAAGTAMVKDIYAGASSSGPGSLTAVANTLFFMASDGVAGAELWKTDGTAAGTVMVKDIYAGASSSGPGFLTAVGNTLFFTANDGTAGIELWKSDGTAAGTVLVKDIYAGASSSSSASLTAVGNTLFLAASDGTHGNQLWKSNGTAAGTVAVTNTAGDGPLSPTPLGNLNGLLILTSTWVDGSSYQHREYWRSDGTTAGTSVLTQTTRSGSDPRDATEWNGRVYVSAQSPTNNYAKALWKTDGTEAGTAVVADYGTICGQPLYPIATAGALFFQSQTCGAPTRTALFKTDGAASGTVPLTPAGTTANAGTRAAVGNTVYFVASETTQGAELWKTDGTVLGTTIVKDIYPGTGSSSPGNLTAMGGTLFFSANDGTHGVELWKSDGSAAGTVMVKDITSATAGASSYPTSLTVVGSALFFVSTTSGTGNELWRSDGTAAGTVMVKDIWPGSLSSSPANLVNVNGTLFFTAIDGVPMGLYGAQTRTGVELWKSDGTAAGTVQVADTWPGSASSNPAQLTAVGRTLFFTANDGVHGIELWKSDGTAAGTQLVIDLVPGSGSGLYLNLAAAPNGVLFMADDGIHGAEPWFSDGTLAGAMGEDRDEGKLFGTHMIQDVNPGSGSGGLGMGFLRALGGDFFGATDGTTGIELWFLPPELTVDNAVVTQPNTGFINATLTVTLGQATATTVTVDYRTIDGTAVAGTDYTTVSGTLTFVPGETTRTITVAVLGKATPSDTHAFSVSLSNAVNAYLGDGQAQVTVLNSHQAPPLGRPQPVWQSFFAVDTRETPMVGDFNGDGLTDIVTFTRSNPNAVGDVYVALSNGAGFGPAQKWSDWFAISQDETVVIGDFDGDGKDDIATWLGKGSRQVYVALSSGSGMAAATVWLSSIGVDSTDVLLSGDVNGDGRRDLLLFARKQGTVYVALSTGTGFSPPTVWHGFFAVSTYERPRVADVNGDGRADIVTFATDSPTAFGDVYIALSNGSLFVDANATPNSSTKWHDWFSIDPNEEIQVGDINGDGKADFLTFLPPSRGGQYYMVVSRGSAMGPNILAPDKVRLSNGDRVLAGDVNGDRMADVIVFAQGEGKVYVTLTR